VYPALQMIRKYRVRLLLWLLMLLPFVPWSMEEVLAQGTSLLAGPSMPTHNIHNGLPKLSILEAKSMLGPSPVIVTGVVTAVGEQGEHSRLLHIQDDSGGLQVTVDQLQEPVAAGDRIQVRGQVVDHRGSMEIRSTAKGVAVLGHGKPVPAPKALSFSDMKNARQVEAIKGTRVRVTGVLDAADAPTGAQSSSLRLQTMDGMKLSLRVPADWEFKPQQGQRYEVTAMFGQFHNEYILVPQTIDDLIQL
jgi:hypothetical protein